MSIVEPCVLELLKHADSRYTLVVEASKRGRQIIGGSKPLLDNEGMKPLKTAVEEPRSDYLRRTERRKRGSGRRCAVNFPTCADGMWCWA